MFVLLALTVAGGAIAGVPGALGGYVAAMLLSAFIPGLEGGACAVPPTEDDEDDEDVEHDDDGVGGETISGNAGDRNAA